MATAIALASSWVIGLLMKGAIVAGKSDCSSIGTSLIDTNDSVRASSIICAAFASVSLMRSFLSRVACPSAASEAAFASQTRIITRKGNRNGIVGGPNGTGRWTKGCHLSKNSVALARSACRLGTFLKAQGSEGTRIPLETEIDRRWRSSEFPRERVPSKMLTFGQCADRRG